MRRAAWIETAASFLIVLALALVMVTTVTQIRSVNRAIACELAIPPDLRSDRLVRFCFTSNGQPPPQLQEAP